MENETNEIVWSDQIGSRRRAAYLLFRTPAGEVVPFAGESVPGVAVVVGRPAFEKAGKWSNFTYRIVTAPGVRAHPGREGWETARFTESLTRYTSSKQEPATWRELAEALSAAFEAPVTAVATQRFLREWRPKAAENIDAAEAALESIAEVSDAGDSAVETVEFGAPTRREMNDGYWESEKTFSLQDGSVVTLTPPARGWFSCPAEEVRSSREDVRIIRITHASGYHGGYVEVTLGAARKD